MKKNVYAYAHTHWDREWYREYEEFRVRLVEVFDDVLKKLQSGELKTFYFDGQTAALDDYLEIKPENEALIKEFIKEKRLYIGPYYCSTDSFLVDSESMIRNLQIGLKCSKKFGCTDFIAYHADTFGHSAQLPDVVNYFGIDYGIFWRGCGDLPSEFIFNGLKSTYLIQGYFQDFFSLPPASFDAKKKAELLKNSLDKIAAQSSDFLLLPLGADHLGISDNLENQIKEVNTYLKDYEIILTTPFEYYKKCKFEKEVNTELRDNTRNFILPGVFSSRIDIKQQNAQMQWELSRITEPLQALCTFSGLSHSFQSETDHAYKTLIKNHAHDSIYGCGIDEIHSENLMRFKKVSQISNAIKNSVLRDLNKENTDEMRVLNLSNYNYTGTVKIKTTKKLNSKKNFQLLTKYKGFPHSKVYDYNQIPITEDYTDIYEYLAPVKNLKPFSIGQIEVREPSAQLKITNDSIENENIKLTVHKGKINLQDKVSNKEYKDYLRIIDFADIGDSYNFGALKGDKKLEAKPVSSKILYKGELKSALEIIWEIKIPEKSSDKGRSSSLKKHCLKMTAALEYSAEYIEITVDWINKAENHILSAEFNLKEPVVQTSSDDLSGTVNRTFDPDYNIYNYVPAPRGIELKYNIAPLQKFVMAQELGLITKGLQEYEVYKNNLRLTLLRSTGILSNPKNPTRGTPAGPPLPTPDLQKIGPNTAHFAIALGKTEKEIRRLSEQFYGVASAFFSDIEPVTFFEIKNENVSVNAVKTDKNNNLIIRLANKTEEKQLADIQFNLPYKKIFKTNACEEKTADFEPFYIKPHGFGTILIEK